MQDAEVIALRALGFLASDEDRLGRFMALSGLSPEAIRKGAPESSFLGGVLDHVLADQTLLLLFAESEGIDPDVIVNLRRKLPGAPLDL